MRGLQGQALPAHSEMQRWKHQYTFFPVWLKFQRSEEEIKHFKVSNFSFGKNSLGIGAFTLSSVWPFTIHQGSSSAVTFCSANLQTVNLWTWLNSTGAQHWKLVRAAFPDGMTSPRLRGGCLSSSSWHCVPSLQEELTQPSTCWDLWAHARGPVTAQRMNLWYRVLLFS